MITGLRVARSTPSISHLFFADDSLMFFKTKRRDFMEVQRILKVYEMESSQTINYGKSTITFGSRMFDTTKSALANIFQVQVVNNHEKYLGVSSNISKNKQVSIFFIKDKRYKALQG